MKKKNNLRSTTDKILEPLCRLLARLGVSPNLVSFAGVLVTLIVPIDILQEKWVPAGWWLLGAGFFDVLDGALARQTGAKSLFGAFWDSTLDRVSEAVVFAGFIMYYGQHQMTRELWLAFSVLTLSFLVPYTRARAEGLGIPCEVGILPRPGRVILLALGFFTAQITFFLALVGILSLITVFQRVFWVWQKTNKPVK